jgi:hypothetical protein
MLNIDCKGTDRFKREKIMMELLGKEIIVAEIHDIFQAPQETRIIQMREKIKNVIADDLVGWYITVQFHPLVPFLDPQITIENNDSHV